MDNAAVPGCPAQISSQHPAGLQALGAPVPVPSDWNGGAQGDIPVQAGPTWPPPRDC